MNRGDFIWSACLGLVAAIMLFPVTRGALLEAGRVHPYPTGFVKFAILATMGELLALRLVLGRWTRPVGLGWRAVVWGLIGMALPLVFEVFNSGVLSAMAKGLLPSTEGVASKILPAFLVSVVMNVLFAPTLMGFHRVADAYIDATHGHPLAFDASAFSRAAEQIDLKGFLTVVVAKTIPFFWIPAHTITFLLPPEYRVQMAAFLSIALGAILAFAKSHRRIESTHLPAAAMRRVP